MLGVTHKADMQLRSLSLKHSLKSHIPNTILSLTLRHNSIKKYNLAHGSKRSLKEGRQVATVRLIQPIIIRPSRTFRLLALRHPANHISLLQALNHRLSPTEPLSSLPLPCRRTLRPKALLRPHMGGHTLRARALSHPLDHNPPDLAFLFRPPINMSLHRAPFLLLNHTRRLLPPPCHMRLRTLFHNHMLHLRALYYLRLPNLQHLPHTGHRISRRRAPCSLYQRPLLQCLNTARLIHHHLHPLSPCRPSLYRNPQLTLNLSLPPPSPLPLSRVPT